MKKFSYLLITIFICLIGISVDAATLGYKNDLKLGDVDRNGKINSTDAAIIYDALFEETELSEIKKVMADVNMDGVVNYVDRKYIVKYAKKSIDCFPNSYNPACATKEIKTELIGDLDEDGKIDDTDVAKVQELILNGDYTAKQLRLADVDLDGELTSLDLLKIKKQASGTKNLEVNKKIKSYKYGDLNIDNNIDSNDLTVLIKTLYKKKDYNLKHQFLGDLNSDKKIDRVDGLILVNYLEKRITTIPMSTNSIGSSNGNTNDSNLIQNGDINWDGKVDESDYLLVGGMVKTGDASLSLLNRFRADINSDGVVDSNDLNMIKSMIGASDDTTDNDTSKDEDNTGDNDTSKDEGNTGNNDTSKDEDNTSDNGTSKDEDNTEKDKNEPNPGTGDISLYLIIGIIAISGIGFVAYRKINN